MCMSALGQRVGGVLGLTVFRLLEINSDQLITKVNFQSNEVRSKVWYFPFFIKKYHAEFE